MTIVAQVIADKRINLPVIAQTTVFQGRINDRATFVSLKLAIEQRR